MKILSINARNSAIEFTLYEMDQESVLAEGCFNRIGMDGSHILIKYHNNRITQEIEIESYQNAVHLLLEKLIDLHILSSLDEIRGVGHRIVQGIDHYTSSMVVTDQILEELDTIKDFAPLHTSGELKCVRAFQEALEGVPMVLVFDSAFHQTMEPEAYLYPVPYRWYTEYGVRKYGFHGTSHRYVTDTVKSLIGKEQFKLISCHLGEGGSVTAIRDMKCVDTTMGFTPVSGIMMGTRSGDIDPSIIPYVMEKEGKNASEIIDDLNRISGILGVSELTNQMSDILIRCSQGDEKAILAKNMFVRKIVDTIAKYYVLLEGANVLVFTSDIGENCVSIRREILEKLSCLGVKIDLDQNNIKGELTKISTNDSSMDVYVIPENESLMIARDTYKLVNR